MIDLKKIIEDLVLEENSGRKKYVRTHFWASDISKCKRALFYEFKDIPKKGFDAKALMIFKAGDMFHDMIKNYFWRSGVLRQEEARLPPIAKEELNLTGRFDAIVSNTPEGERELTEIKSISHFGFEHMDEPKKEWVLQLMIYLHYLKVKKGIIFAINKNTSQMKQWEVNYDPEIFKKVVNYFKTVSKHIKSNKEPNREHPRDSWQCGYCKFSKYCWKDIPIPEPPAFKIDEAVEPPSQEILESAVNTYCYLKNEIKKLTDECGSAEEVIKQYFKTNQETSVSSDENIIERIQRQKVIFDSEKLLKKLGAEKYAVISKPQSKLISQALKDGLVDPTAVEESKDYEFTEALSIKKEEDDLFEKKTEAKEPAKKKLRKKKK